ncbi:MAG TPA: FecR domain-containing protein [Gammaproteobacteria bacterium]
MSNLLQFPDPRRIMREASSWIVSLDEGLTDDERRELEAWLAADPRHAKALLRLAETWDRFEALSELARMFPLEQYPPRRRRWLALHGGTWRLKPALLAAALAAAVGLGTAAWYARPGAVAPDAPEPIQVALPDARGNDGPAVAAEASAAAQRSYQTAVGEQLSARLPDGSVITLNTDTLLDVDYTPAERRVAIRRGEASFNVASEPARPFRVLAGGAVVQAVGTVFNVLAAADRVEVTVSEGRVRVTSAEPEAPPEGRPAAPAEPALDMTVGAGEVAVIGGPQEAVRRADALELEAKLAWQQGMLIFRGDPLETVLADVSRYTTVKFTIADDSIRAKRVGGYFRTGDIDALLIALRESFGIEPQRVGDEIILTARD